MRIQAVPPEIDLVRRACTGLAAVGDGEQQTVVAPEMQGRFFTLNQSIFSAMGPLALIAAAPLADRFGVRPFWLACAAGGLVIVLIRRFVPAIYTMEDRPDVGRSA